MNNTYYIDNKGKLITYLEKLDEQQKFEAYGWWQAQNGDVKFKLKRVEL